VCSSDLVKGSSRLIELLAKATSVLWPGATATAREASSIATMPIRMTVDDTS
jgi:hypothetical protein